MWKTVLMLPLLVASAAWAEDVPTVSVSRDHLAPQSLEARVGEIVTWRAVDGSVLRLEMDPNPPGHDVIVRAGTIRAVFTLPGVHGYSMVVEGDRLRRLQGRVVVKESERPSVDLPWCAGQTSRRICVEP
jgi:hypothetical protein